MRGEIQNRERAAQLRDFSGLRFGNITPTDIDGFLEFWDTLYVHLEAKVEGAELPQGQRLALERACDALQDSRPYAVVLVLDHDVPPDQPIPFASCPVREWRYKRNWRIPIKPINCREAIERLLEMAGIVL